MSNKKNYINCGFNSHFDPESGLRFEKTASGEFVEVDDGVKGILEREFVKKAMEIFKEDNKL